MSDIRIDTDTGDIEIIEGELSLTSGTDAIRQHLKQRLNTYFREWFLDQRIGIPYFEHILKKNPVPSVIDSIFKREILTTPGVIELIEFNLDFEPGLRELSLSFKARVIDGIVDFTEILGVA